jgi:hypothetical protein
VAHHSVSSSLEYIDFEEKPRFMSLVGMTDSMQEAVHLEGMELGELMFNWPSEAEVRDQGGKGRQPAEGAAYALLQFHIVGRLEFRDGPICSSVAVSHIFEYAREDTSNWQAETTVGSPALPLRKSPLVRQRAEIDAILKYHDGEARIWQSQPEHWEPLLESTIAEWGEVGMGRDFAGTRLQRTAAARGAAYVKREIDHCSRRRSVEDFGSSYTLSTLSCGRPDLNNAVSTLVVRGVASNQVGASLYWLRRVHVITLPEVYSNYQHDETFDTIYAAWLEGAVVFRKRAMRGTAGHEESNVVYEASSASRQRRWHLRGISIKRRPGGDSTCIFYLQMHFEKFAVAVDDHRGPTASGVGSSEDAPCPSSQRRVKQR